MNPISKSIPPQGTIGVFVPYGPPKRGKRSAKVGWITDANGCDIWQGGRANGYPIVGDAGRSRSATRVRYEREIGPIPEGMDLDHFVCDNGPGGCCNPHHCRPVTRRENVLRGNGPTSLCAAKTHCRKGHPLSGENLAKFELSLGWRSCRICARENDRRRYWKDKARASGGAKT